ncbi:hypothetical protein R3W88_022537 [Solanum pinnatisectum]|uniref:Uncharacterized protein n=1 Tax=Solanum pinnatisectum TaxID=50273 RepID=A0AAV9LUV8_9SOLN|nr:hypothetical protein R3W88_022537 [Solanum pinnatisectum]
MMCYCWSFWRSKYVHKRSMLITRRFNSPICYSRRAMASMGDYVAIEALGLAATDKVGIISDEATVLIVEYIFDRVLLVVQVRNEESVLICLTIDRVKYECSANGYFGEVSKFNYQHKSVSPSKNNSKNKRVSPLTKITYKANIICFT